MRCPHAASRVIDDTLIALADPVRRGIVELLKVQPRRAGELATLLEHQRADDEQTSEDAARQRADRRGTAADDARVRVYRLRPERLEELTRLAQRRRRVLERSTRVVQSGRRCRGETLDVKRHTKGAQPEIESGKRK